MFSNAIALDSATWARARGWTLWKALCTPRPGTNRRLLMKCFLIIKYRIIAINDNNDYYHVYNDYFA